MVLEPEDVALEVIGVVVVTLPSDVVVPRAVVIVDEARVVVVAVVVVVVELVVLIATTRPTVGRSEVSLSNRFDRVVVEVG